NTGPANAVIVSVVLPEIRASAIALSIFAFHLLGDVPSPLLIGKISDWTGSLERSVLINIVAIFLSGIFYLLGSRTLGRDTARVLEVVREREEEERPRARDPRDPRAERLSSSA